MTSMIAVQSGGAYVDLPAPVYRDGYSAVWEEIVRADRNTLGDLIKNRITTKYTISLKWVGLTAQQKNTILDVTSPNKFNARFVSLMDDQVVYADLYRGAGLVVIPYGKRTGDTFQYYDIEMELVEV